MQYRPINCNNYVSLVKLVSHGFVFVFILVGIVGSQYTNELTLHPQPFVHCERYFETCRLVLNVSVLAFSNTCNFSSRLPLIGWDVCSLQAIFEGSYTVSKWILASHTGNAIAIRFIGPKFTFSCSVGISRLSTVEKRTCPALYGFSQYYRHLSARCSPSGSDFTPNWLDWNFFVNLCLMLWHVFLKYPFELLAARQSKKFLNNLLLFQSSSLYMGSLLSNLCTVSVARPAGRNVEDCRGGSRSDCIDM